MISRFAHRRSFHTANLRRRRGRPQCEAAAHCRKCTFPCSACRGPLRAQLAPGPHATPKPGTSPCRQREGGRHPAAHPKEYAYDSRRPRAAVSTCGDIVLPEPCPCNAGRIDHIICGEVVQGGRVILDAENRTLASAKINAAALPRDPICTQTQNTTCHRADAARFKVHYILPSGKTKTVTALPGDNLMDLAIANNIDIEGTGAPDCVPSPSQARAAAWRHARRATWWSSRSSSRGCPRRTTRSWTCWTWLLG